MAENELCVVNLAELTKQLIRWFQFKQITDQNEVFDLLIMIFSVSCVNFSFEYHFLTSLALDFSEKTF
jgi:hypothetical protein